MDKFYKKETKETNTCSKRQMELVKIMLNETSQPQKDKYYIVFLVSGAEI